MKRYFEPKLATLIIKDRNKAAKRGDVSTLDMDPFIDAQDWDISAFDIAVRDTGADKATATVSFKNMGKPTTVVLDLVKLREGWRIADINWGRKPTLRGLFAKAIERIRFRAGYEGPRRARLSTKSELV